MPKVTVWWKRRDPWQRKLYWATFARAGGTCEICYREPADQIHHLTYSTHRREQLRDLKACCAVCHAKIHNPEAANDNNPDQGQLGFG